MIGNYGKALAKGKMLFVAGLFSLGIPSAANAQKFNSLIPNPFAFCSAPKPCKYCHPWRAIYNELCANQVDPKETTEKYESSAGTEVTQAEVPRIVNDRALRADSRVVLEEMSTNVEGTVEGLEVTQGPSRVRPVDGLDINGLTRVAQ
jgi:hypothetical protein